MNLRIVRLGGSQIELLANGQSGLNEHIKLLAPRTVEQPPPTIDLKAQEEPEPRLIGGVDKRELRQRQKDYERQMRSKTKRR